MKDLKVGRRKRGGGRPVKQRRQVEAGARAAEAGEDGRERRWWLIDRRQEWPVEESSLEEWSHGGQVSRREEGTGGKGI